TSYTCCSVTWAPPPVPSRGRPSTWRSRSQRAGEDLPGQGGLCGEAQHDVDLLAEQVVLPPPLGAVLQPLVEGEDVEEDEQRHEDPVDETGRRGRRRRARRQQVDRDCHPGDHAGHTSEAEW